MPIGPTEWEQENKGVAQAEFNQAALEAQAEPPEANQGQGSEMVENDKPEPALKPEGELRNAVDGQVYNDRLAAEAQAADQLTPEEAEALELSQSFPGDQGQDQNLANQELTPEEKEALELSESFQDLSQGQDQLAQELSR